MIRVIFADDHAMFRQGMEMMLASVDDIDLVACAKSGEEAVKLACKVHPNVALIDVHMDGLGGLGAARKLRERAPNCAIIALTGHKDMTYPDLFFQAGALGYLSKQAPLDEMVEAIRSVNDGKAYFDSRVAKRVAKAGNGDENPFSALSERERQVCRLLAEGFDCNAISEQLGVRLRTVSAYHQRSFEKLNIQSDIELLRLALRFGITEN
ncbi:MAG: response regulator [Pseudomonadales bacterium]|nr:response regulator [Pseudomonadales bacterium]RZV57205.1 MAG: response regulator [Pseudomonadales bacterium]